MSVSIFVLKNGITLISQSDELDYEPKCHLIGPCTISGKAKLTLTRWPEHTADSDILLRSEDLLTVCEPTEAALNAYLKKVGKTTEDLTAESEAVMLNEEQQQAQIPDISSVPDFDDYEPHYQEF